MHWIFDVLNTAATFLLAGPHWTAKFIISVHCLACSTLWKLHHVEVPQICAVSMTSCCPMIGREASVMLQVSINCQHLMSPCRCIHAPNASASSNWHTASQHLMSRHWHQWMRCTLSASVYYVLCLACLSLPLVMQIVCSHLVLLSSLHCHTAQHHRHPLNFRVGLTVERRIQPQCSNGGMRKALETCLFTLHIHLAIAHH